MVNRQLGLGTVAPPPGRAGHDAVGAYLACMFNNALTSGLM